MDNVFTDAEFMTAKEKAAVLKDWERLLKAMATGDFGSTEETECGRKSSKFTKRLYNHLHLHCGHIAHYNQSGFFYAQFGDSEKIINFVETFHSHTTFCASDYRDITRAMGQMLVDYGPKIVARCIVAEREQDITVGKALLAKHGITV